MMQLRSVILIFALVTPSTALALQEGEEGPSLLKELSMKLLEANALSGEYEDFVVEGTQHDVTGVEQSTCYYRVRAANTAVTSVNSNTIMVLLVGIDDASTGIDPVRIIARRGGIMVEVLYEAYRNSELMIYNLLGQPVVSCKLAGTSQYIPLYTRSQVLVVRIQNASQSFSRKLVVR